MCYALEEERTNTSHSAPAPARGAFRTHPKPCTWKASAIRGRAARPRAEGNYCSAGREACQPSRSAPTDERQARRERCSVPAVTRQRAERSSPPPQSSCGRPRSRAPTSAASQLCITPAFRSHGAEAPSTARPAAPCCRRSTAPAFASPAP